MAEKGYFPPNAPAPPGGYPQGQEYMQGVPAGYPQAPPSYNTAGKFFKKTISTGTIRVSLEIWVFDIQYKQSSHKIWTLEKAILNNTEISNDHL